MDHAAVLQQAQVLAVVTVVVTSKSNKVKKQNDNFVCAAPFWKVHFFVVTARLRGENGSLHFSEHAIFSQKRHVETSRREEEMGQVKGSGEGTGREKYFFLPSSSPFPSFALAPTVRVTISTLPNLPLS